MLNLDGTFETASRPDFFHTVIHLIYLTFLYNNRVRLKPEQA